MTPELALQVQRMLTENTDRFIQETKLLMEEKGLKQAIARRDDDKILIGRSQFQTLMRIASDAGSFDELLLWLRYQEAKNKEAKYNKETQKYEFTSWARSCADDIPAAKHVIASLECITEKVLSEFQKKHRLLKDDERIVKLTIAGKYLGYLYWQATIATKGA